ncbi:MAG: hypothetical protein E7272_02020 [Pseudobutyrivibrio ruminis]|uniref:Uncharacterized protein n=1 Tax=Pseudobutyrivibrio ruminis TaxID=46206 RepID=A0A927U5D4_9FIRM|nr:hypothetical protein [Pseudobutyrivibrio ruminis]
MLRKIKDSGRVNIILAITAVICYLAVIFTTLTYGRVTINSDVALVYRFYNAIVNTKSIYPTSWNAVNGEIYAFTRLPVNVLMLALLKDKVLAIVVSNCIVFTLSITAVIWFAKKFFNNDFWLVFIPLFSVFLCGKEARMMIFLHGAYCGFIIIFTFVLGMFWLDVINRKTTICHTAIHSIIFFLMILGGKRHVAEYLLPTIATLVVYFVFINRDKERKVVTIRDSLLKLAVPAILAYLLYKAVCSTHNMNFGGNSNPTLSFGIKHIIENVKIHFSNLFNIFGYAPERSTLANIICIIVCVAICIIIPVLQAFEFKKMKETEKVFFTFMLMHNAEILLATVLGDLLQVRYLLSTSFLLVLVSTNYIYKKIASAKIMQIQIVVSCCFLILSGLYCRNLLKLTNNWQDKYEAQKSISKELVAHGVTKGYATFWLGYPNEVYSDGKLTFGGVDIAEASFMKQYSNCDNSCYEYKEGKCCVLLTDSEVEYLVNVAGGDFISTFATKPIDYFVISNPYFNELYGTDNILVYVFEKDICDRLTDGLKDGVLNPREMFYNYVGSRSDDAIVLTKGGVIHGPYKKIAPGKYTIVYNGKNLGDCGVEVKSELTPASIEYSIVSQGNNKIELDVTIENYVEDIQFYLVNDNDDEVEFDRIDIVEK